MKSGAIIEAGTRQRIEVVLLAGLFAALFAPFMASLVEAWQNRPDASHGWLVLGLAGWFIWRRRDVVRAEPAATYGPAIAIVVFGLLAAVVAVRASLESVGRMALVITLNGLLLYHLGVARYRQIAFPALFLFLMVPVPITITGMFTFPLQLFASTASEFAIELLGIPVARTGNVLALPGGKLEVAEACSGLRSAMTFVTLGVLLAWLTPGVGKKILLVALSVPLALLANVLRITSTAVLLTMFGPAAIHGIAHDAVGIVSFLTGIALYAAISRMLGSRWTTT